MRAVADSKIYPGVSAVFRVGERRLGAEGDTGKINFILHSKSRNAAGKDRRCRHVGCANNERVDAVAGGDGAAVADTDRVVAFADGNAATIADTDRVVAVTDRDRVVAGLVVEDVIVAVAERDCLCVADRYLVAGAVAKGDCIGVAVHYISGAVAEGNRRCRR